MESFCQDACTGRFRKVLHSKTIAMSHGGLWVPHSQSAVYSAPIEIRLNLHWALLGEESYTNFVEFYEKFEKDYKKFFTNGSIYNDWVGSVSEMHELVD